MPSAFKSTRAGVRVNLPAEHRDLLADLLAQLDDLLDPDGAAAGDRLTAEPPAEPDAAPAHSPVIEGDDDIFAALVATIDRPSTRPSDPALARLLPDGHHDDVEVAAEYRRLTEATLRQRKRGNADLARGALSRPDPVVLTRPEAMALMKALTDLRLVFAARLQLEHDDDLERLLDAMAALPDPALAEQTLGLVDLYEALGYWQESLVGAVRPGTRPGT